MPFPQVAVAVFLLAVLGCAHTTGGQTAQSVLHEIESQGAARTLQARYADPPAWASVLRNVGSGAPEWFQVAEALRSVSDAGASEELDCAVGEALGANPGLVLGHATGPFFVSEVCSAPDVDDERFGSLQLALAELNRRIAAVQNVAEPGLTLVRDDCLSSLVQSEHGLRRFFGAVR
jgi:hypothetical protein